MLIVNLIFQSHNVKIYQGSNVTSQQEDPGELL